MILKLSRHECDILNHRLAVPDCIADGLEGTFTREQVHDAVSNLVVAVKAGRIDPLDLDDLAREVLADCIEGSTWCAAAAAEARETGDRSALSSAVRCINTLSRKLRMAGIDVRSVPLQ